jgi:hypothetical protein
LLENVLDESAIKRVMITRETLKSACQELVFAICHKKSHYGAKVAEMMKY